jgi:hypothetical protein
MKINECGAVVRGVDQVTLLPSDAKLDSAAVASPALPFVETVSDDDSVLAVGATCATPADTAVSLGRAADLSDLLPS